MRKNVNNFVRQMFRFRDSMPRSVTLLLCMGRVKDGFLGKNATEKHEEIYKYLLERHLLAKLDQKEKEQI